MNKRHIILGAVACITCLVALMMRPDILGALIVFVFLGMVPGTDITLPWWVTLGAMAIALIFAIRWVFDEPVYRPIATPKDRARRVTARRKVIKQTSSRAQVKHTKPVRKIARAKA